MQWFSQDKYEIRLEWGLSAVEHLARKVDCAVIVDVMSFSTCVSLAVDNGARIYPYPWKDESARKIGAKTASLACQLYGDFYASVKRIHDGW